MFIRIVVSKNIGTLKGRRKPLHEQRFPAVEFDFRPHGSSPWRRNVSRGGTHSEGGVAISGCTDG